MYQLVSQDMAMYYSLKPYKQNSPTTTNEEQNPNHYPLYIGRLTSQHQTFTCLPCLIDRHRSWANVGPLSRLVFATSHVRELSGSLSNGFGPMGNVSLFTNYRCIYCNRRQAGFAYPPGIGSVLAGIRGHDLQELP